MFHVFASKKPGNARQDQQFGCNTKTLIVATWTTSVRAPAMVFTSDAIKITRLACEKPKTNTLTHLRVGQQKCMNYKWTLSMPTMNPMACPSGTNQLSI